MVQMKGSQLDFIDLLESSKRGKLKVYIGSIAGVGKTCRMLSEAHKLKDRGIDVVLGYIETHGRKDTEELVKDLEIVPRIMVEYNGLEIEEMDVDAILNRGPEVVIVDELPHTNLPTSRNQKRYQDVIELLLAGINVICAMNVQHLESLNDIVFAATGIKVTETVPDSFFEYADQVINIDLSPEDLIDRLKAGNIYPPDKIEYALNNFFRFDNISQLRELALREVAERVDVKVEDKGSLEPKPRSTSDRLMVLYCPQIYSQKYMIRKASRLAGKLNTDWFLVFVEDAKNNLSNIDSIKQRNFYNDVQLAEELGANFIHLVDDKVNQCILDFAVAEDIKHIMMNVSIDSNLSWIFGKSLLKTLLELNKFDIHLASKDLTIS